MVVHGGAARQPTQADFRLAGNTPSTAFFFNCFVVCREVPADQKTVRLRPEFQMGGNVYGARAVCHVVCNARQILAGDNFGGVLFRGCH